MSDKNPSLKDAAQEALDALKECVEDSREAINTYIANYGEDWRPHRLAALRKIAANADKAIESLEAAILREPA